MSPCDGSSIVESWCRTSTDVLYEDVDWKRQPGRISASLAWSSSNTSIRLRRAVRLHDQPCDPKSSSPRVIVAMLPTPGLTRTASSFLIRKASRKCSMARRSARNIREPASEYVDPVESREGVLI